MNTAMTLAMAALTISMVACAADAPPEQTGQSEDHIDAACVSNIKAPPGSAAWSAELHKCLAAGSGSGSSSGGYDPGNYGGGNYGGGQSCSQRTSCINGSCTCAAGPNTGVACIGSSLTGATACNVLCKVCQ